MTIPQLNAFLAVAQTLNFSKAAEQLHIAQPAISRYIQQLEDDMGVILIDRSVKKDIHLTKAGKVLFKSASECQKIMEDAVLEIQKEADNMPVSVNLVDDILMPRQLMDRFTKFNNENPDISVYINFIKIGNLQEKLEIGEFILVSEDILRTCKNYTMMNLPVELVPYQIYFSSNHEINMKKQNIQVTDFVSYPLFLPSNQPEGYIDILIKMFDREAGIVQKVTEKLLLKLNDYDTVFQLLQADQGFTIADGWSKGRHLPGISCINLNRKTRYVLAWDPDKCNTKNIQRMKQLLK